MGLFSDMAVLGHQGCWSTEWRKAWLITIIPAPSRPGCVTTKDGLLQERVKISGVWSLWVGVVPLHPGVCLRKPFLRVLLHHFLTPMGIKWAPSSCKVTNRDCTCFCVEECLQHTLHPSPSSHSLGLSCFIIFFQGIQFSLLFHYIFATSYRK